VLKTVLLDHSRFTLFTILASIWLIIVGLLLFNDFDTKQQEAFSRLDFKTQASAYQFEYDWPEHSLKERQTKDEYLRSFSQGFDPQLYFSVINSNGRVDASSLNNLTQLSYGPLIKKFAANLQQDNHCLVDLRGLQQEPVSACVFYYPHLKVYFVASLHAPRFFDYWIKHSGFFLMALTLALLMFFILFYFLTLQQKKVSAKQYLLTKKYQQQDHDFKRLISNLPGLVYRLKLDDKSLDYVSPGSFQLLGYAPEHFITHGVTPFDLIDPEDQEEYQRLSHAAHFSKKPFELIYRVTALNGEQKWILDRGRCFQGGLNEHFIEGVMLDITERELVRQQIEYLAVQDPLTELYNRYKFNDELVNAVDDCNRKYQKFAMLFIDLDRFKNINDSLGHQLGDRLLRKVASRLRSLIPKEHFLARMGGDEFVILVRFNDHTDEVAELAQQVNQALRKPFNINAYQLSTSCSIGISVCPHDSIHSHVLWRYADTAMYQIKKTGGDGYQFFTEKMGELVQHRINIEHGFIPALENKEFELYFQPQLDINTGVVIGAEALLRWKHPTLGFISPVEFIPVAEETGFIHELGDWIIHQSLSQLERWQKIKPNMTMAVNVSALQITTDFPKKIAKFLHQYNIKPYTLELEITETLLMENIDFVKPLLSEICELGVFFAIDDFGTGYSSLSYLRYLPINKLKIDRAFVLNLENNKDDVVMVKAIIAMARSLNLKVLAEGIETEPQLNILKEQGCGFYQGYYFSRPIEKETFYSLYIKGDATVQSPLS
jgi:diguanylate cyclase (GGDEF)-like protein